MRRFMLTVPALVLAWCIPTMAGGEKGTTVVFGNLKSTTPANWKAGKPSNKFRVYEFKVPKAGGDARDAEVAVFYFQGGGGNANDNVERQKKKFTPAEGQKIRSTVENFKVGKADVTYLDISGTYTDKNPPFDPKAKEERLPNYRMLYVYFSGDEGGPYFIRFVGPAKTIEQSKKGFDDWIKNFK